MAPGIKLDFDHVALAANDPTPVLELLVGRLGATDLYGAVDRGFRWVLLHAGDAGGGMLIELLDAWSVQEDPFLARFLERRGEGAHHLTFKTSDIHASIAAFESAGLEVIDRQLENPVWQEAFVRPRDAHGTIVQLVQTTIVRPPLADMLSVARGPQAGSLDVFAGGTGDQVAEPWWVSPEHRGDPVALRCVVFAAEAPEAAASFYEHLLGGARVASRGQDRIELAWPSGAHVGFERAGGNGTGIVALEFEDAAIESFRIGRTAIAVGAALP
jgi:catechol 2,3-dioxygenase-like lactoylglutathione lyase family enzyme